MHDSARIAVTALLAAGLVLAAALRPVYAQSGAPLPVDVDGDLRLRWEAIDAEGGDDPRRARLRARFGASIAPAERLRIGVRLATGDGNPVSRNLTLDSDFSGRDILVDRAHVDWRFSEAATVRVGKFGLPWFRPGGSQLVWDSDLAPEGLVMTVDTGRVFGSAATLAVDRPESDDPLLYALQAGFRGKLPGEVSLVAGVGYFDYDDSAGGLPFYDGAPRGNRVDAAGNYLADFRLLELFAELRLTSGGLPVVAFADYVRNTAASVDDDGHAIGIRVGEARKPGGFRVDVGWQETEPDAVIGIYTWSDMAAGEADSRGAFVKTTYALRENIAFGATLIASQRAVASGPTRDFDRLMLDVGFSFD